MSFKETIAQFNAELGLKLTYFFRRLLIFLLFAGIFILILVVIIKMIMRWRRHQQVTAEQDKALITGRMNAKKLKLRYLFLSENDRKHVNAGKIIGFVKMKDNEDDREYDVFIVKNKFDFIKFYKMLPEDHSDMEGDITVYHWNFSLDPNSRYLVYNKNQIKDDNINKLVDKEELGVDSIGSLKPIIQKAVQINPLHRISIRMKSLIPHPEESYDFETQDGDEKK